MSDIIKKIAFICSYVKIGCFCFCWADLWTYYGDYGGRFGIELSYMPKLGRPFTLFYWWQKDKNIIFLNRRLSLS